MSYDEGQLQRTCRRHLLTMPELIDVRTSLALEVQPGGGADLVRKNGSFLTDGFFPGMEVRLSAFRDDANNTLATIEEVSTLRMTLGSPYTIDFIIRAEAESGWGPKFDDDRVFVEAARRNNCRIRVELPALQRWENTAIVPDPDVPYFEEVWISGPQSQRGAGPGGIALTTPQYGIRFHVQEDVGSAALNRYLAALMDHFPPRLSLAVEGSEHRLRVRSDTGPYPGTRLPTGETSYGTLLTIPLRYYFPNFTPSDEGY